MRLWILLILSSGSVTYTLKMEATALIGACAPKLLNFYSHSIEMYVDVALVDG